MSSKLHLQLKCNSAEFQGDWQNDYSGHTGLLLLKLALATAFFISLWACSSPQQYPPCIGEMTQQLTFSWGDHDIATGRIEGYKLDATGKVFSVERPSDTSAYIFTLVNTLPDSIYCNSYVLVTKEVMKTQTLNSAIDIERYVEYSNPGTNAVMRASWNPKYETKGNKGFMVLFDYLNSLVDYGK